MPNYTWKCDACENEFEEFQTIQKFKTRKKCPQCKKIKLYQVYNAPYGMVRGTTGVTVGTYAERNAKRLGKDYIEEKRGKEIEQQLNSEINKPAPEGMERIKRTKDAPWWRPNTLKPDKKLVNMTPKQKKRYILEGKK